MEEYTINWTPEKEREAIEKLTEYFKKFGSGECIVQSDDATIEGIELLSDIADDILGDDGLVWNGDEDE